MAFVVSEGALQSVAKPGGRPAYRLDLGQGFTQDYAAIWRAQPAVRTVVTFLARNIAQLGLHAFERVSDDERRRLTDHALPRLIAKPNPATTRYRLLSGLVHDLGIYDVAYWLKQGTADEPVVWRLPPAMVTPKGDNWLFPERFEVKGAKGKTEYRADQVVFFRGYNPDNNTAGTSPIEALRRILAEEHAAGNMREQTLRNGARMSGYIKRPAGAGRRGDPGGWSPTARARFKAEWQAQYAGDGPQAGGTPILEDGMEFVPASQTAQQLEYVSSRKLTREEVAAAYFIPPPMVGILDHATFGNIEEQHKMLYADTLGPYLTMIQDELALQLVPDLDTSGRVYVEFNLAEKLRGSFEEQAQQLSTSVGAPWLTRNEARARQNLPPVEGGDVLVVPLNVLEGGLASPRDTAPVPGQASAELPARKTTGPVSVKARPPEGYTTKAEQVLQAFFNRQRAVIKSRLGAKAAGDVWDDDRWNAELSDDLYALAATVTPDVAGRTLRALGFDPDVYDTDRTFAFLRAVADRIGKQVNEVTKADVLAAVAAAEADGGDRLAAVDHVFDVAEEARAQSAGTSTITVLAGFASVEAAKQATGGQATKTWTVTSSNPRASHAAMNGETVGIDERFSNGARWPADGVLSVDDIAGCRCDVVINIPT